MAQVWIKGYTKPDGTKVTGHYRDVKGVSSKNVSLARKASKTKVKKAAVEMFGKAAIRGPRLSPDKGRQTRSSQNYLARASRTQALKYG